MLNWIPYFIATVIPFLFVIFLYIHDIYKTGKPTLLLASFIWGGLAFLAALYLQTTFFYGELGYSSGRISLFVAPWLEELLKGIFLWLLVRQARFTYFVDGVIYGAAVGIAFAICENYLYLQQTGVDAQLGTAIGRVISVNLMHASATGLMGIMAGIGRWQEDSWQLLVFLTGYVAAVIAHAVFNGVVNNPTIANAFMALTLCSSSLGFVAAFVIWEALKLGLSEQKRWIADKLEEISGTVSAEINVTYLADDLDQLEPPLIELFGEEKTAQIMKMLAFQAQLGIRYMERDRLRDKRQKTTVNLEIDRLHQALTAAEEDVGGYYLASLRTFFPKQEYNK